MTLYEEMITALNDSLERLEFHIKEDKLISKIKKLMNTYEQENGVSIKKIKITGSKFYNATEVKYRKEK